MEAKKYNKGPFTVDLNKVEGSGEFPCPKCRTLLSPGDSERVNYEIIETKVRGDDLESMTLRCKRCQSSIRLIGFLEEGEYKSSK